MKPKVFISYSRQDAHLIKPLLQLLQINGHKVFLDTDSIGLGDRWKQELKQAIRRSNIFILFWCCHSSHSKYVAEEVRAALKDKKKRVIPALFCHAPMRKKIKEFQWLDFRTLVRHE